MKKQTNNKSRWAVMGLFIVGLLATIGIVSAQGMGLFKDTQTRDTLRQATQDGDYNGWYDTMSSVLTEENFQEIVQRHNERTQIQDAIENQDYDAWVSAMQNIFTEEHFNQMVDMHENMGMKNMRKGNMENSGNFRFHNNGQRMGIHRPNMDQTESQE